MGSSQEEKDQDSIRHYKGSVSQFKQMFDDLAGGENTNAYDTPEYQGFDKVHPVRGEKKSPHWDETNENHIPPFENFSTMNEATKEEDAIAFRIKLLLKQGARASVKDGEDKLYKLSQEFEEWNVDNDDKYDSLVDPLFAAVELIQDAGVPGTNNVEDDKEYRMYIKSAEKHLKQFNKDCAKALKSHR